MKHMRLGITFLVIGLAFAGPANASEAITEQIQNLTNEMKKMRQDYESRISDLQAEVKKLQKNQAKELAKVEEKADEVHERFDVDYVGRQNGPFEKGGLIVREHSGFGNVSLGGYADIELENFQNRNSTFDQHRWIINVGAEIGERLRFYSEYEIEHGGPSAGGEAKVEQAWIDFLIHDAVNLRAGALLVPFGRYNLYHDSDLQDLTDRPLVNRDVIPTTWTESGAGIWGEFNPQIGEYEDTTVGYEFYFVNGLDEGFSDTGLRGARGSIETDNNNQKALVGRLAVSPAIGHELGLSGYWGEFNGNRDDITGFGIDWFTSWGPLEFIGEYAYFNISQLELSDRAVTDEAQGFYLQTNYHFWAEFLDDTFLGRAFDNPTFTLVGRYGWVNIDDDGDAGTGDNSEQRWTLGINYRPVESWVLKLEYQNNASRIEALERGNDEGFIASIAMGF
ncbi:MAG: porin [Candidatus Omnitrophota bacterium]|nr:porin [Candidatus Omnitrophota bacterium]